MGRCSLMRKCRNCVGEGANSAAEDESCVTVRLAVLQRGHKLAGRQRFHKGWLGRAAQLDMGQVGLSVVHHPVSDCLTMIGSNWTILFLKLMSYPKL